MHPRQGFQYHYLVRLKQAVFRDFAILAGFRLFHGFAGRRRRPAILADFIHFKPISSISTSFHGFELISLLACWPPQAAGDFGRFQANFIYLNTISQF